MHTLWKKNMNSSTCWGEKVILRVLLLSFGDLWGSGMSSYSRNMLHHQILFPHVGLQWQSDRKKDRRVLIPELDRALHQVCSVMKPRPVGADERQLRRRMSSQHPPPPLHSSRSAVCHFQHRLFFPETARPTCPSGAVRKPLGFSITALRIGTGGNGGGIRGNRINRFKSSGQQHKDASAGRASPPVLTPKLI